MTREQAMEQVLRSLQVADWHGAGSESCRACGRHAIRTYDYGDGRLPRPFDIGTDPIAAVGWVPGCGAECPIAAVLASPERT